MKPLTLAAAFTLISLSSLASAEPATGKLADGDRVAVLGDSITEQKNYSALIEDYLLACQPAAGLQVAQFGWGGETTWGFVPRMAQDVLWYKPTVATIAYGMNDGGYGPVDAKRLNDYIRSTREIVRQLKASGTRTIIVGGPGAVDSDAFRTFTARGREAADMYNKTLNTFGEAAEAVAREEGVVFANLHNVMADAMAKFKQLHPDSSFVGGDGIHPDNVGHTVMAYAFLKAMGCDGDIGTITVDLTSGNAEATPGHAVISADVGKVTIESSRYPFQAIKNNDPLGIAAAMDVVPFHEELNRFKLILRNVPAGKSVHVTWSEVPDVKDDNGRPAKPIAVEGEFTADQLSAGINLAAAFNTTPFERAWGRLDRAVHAKQDFETPLNKYWLHHQKTWSAQSPSTAKQFEDLAEVGKQFDEKLRAVAGTFVAPVRHVLRFEVR